MRSPTALSPRTLRPRPPFELAHTLTYFTRRAGELVDRVEDGAYRRLFVLPEGRFLAELEDATRTDSQARPIEQPHTSPPALSLTVVPLDASTTMEARRAAEETIAARLERTLGLQDDLEPFRVVARGDAPLAALVDRYVGLRLVSTPTAFEAFVWAVIGQQISLHVAFRLKAALVRTLGCAAERGGRTYYAFPTPEAIAAAGPAALAALGLGQRKAATLTASAAAVSAGTLDFEALGALPLDEAERILTALHGVGPWTAHYVLLRGLRRLDAIPVSDMGLRVAAGAAYGLGRKASITEVAAFSERWRPFRGLAAFYLWYSLADVSPRSP